MPIHLMCKNIGGLSTPLPHVAKMMRSHRFVTMVYVMFHAISLENTFFGFKLKFEIKAPLFYPLSPSLGSSFHRIPGNENNTLRVYLKSAI